jgi:hypothetical protein
LEESKGIMKWANNGHFLPLLDCYFYTSLRTESRPILLTTLAWRVAFKSTRTTEVFQMGRDGRPPLDRVIGPDGEELTLADLPAPDVKRWVIRRKAAVVAAVQGGLITLEEACAHYRLSVEEYSSWQRAVQKFGMAGLRVTHSQEYRRHYAQ